MKVQRAKRRPWARGGRIRNSRGAGAVLLAMAAAAYVRWRYGPWPASLLVIGVVAALLVAKWLDERRSR